MSEEGGKTMGGEEIRKAQEKAWDEGAIHAFSHSGEGWNGEYPFDDGKDPSFIPEVTKNNPYRREKAA